MLYIHPTKGYRGAARPRKTNRRRRPIKVAVSAYAGKRVPVRR